MRSKLYFLCIGLLFFSGNPFAHEKSNVKFGNVSEKDFNTKIYPIDSNASAVVIADIGYSAIEGNTKGWFSLVYKHFKRLHIINKNGYDAANVSISLYADGDAEEELNKLKAVTYNLENGKVVETKLDVKASVFKDKISKNRVVKKFTFPNVKEGSIIEYEYTITSDFLQNLQPWEFQGAYPRLWSEYNLALPEFLGYVFLTRGYKKYDINDKKLRSESFTILDSRGIGASERYQFTANVSDNRWVMKNVPALKEESFTSTIDNHIAKIEFQLSEYRQPLTYRNIMGSWPKLANDLMEADFFGKPVTKDNGWLKDIVKPLIEGVNGNKEKAHKIFAYVRDNFTCTNHSDLFAEQTLKNLEKSKSGTVAEINLLLTAMLRYADIEADPVILSGHLPVRCYNGHGRVINKTADAIELESDSLMERKSTTVFVVNDEKGNIVGSMLQNPGYYESFNLRERIKEKGKEQLITDIKKAFGTEILVSKFELDSLDKYEEVLGIKYDFDFTGEKEDIIYLNPMFGEGYKENPFKSAERLYPVEMPYGFDETYTLQMDVPSGYEVDELPKSMVVKLNEENEGMFEYRISQSGSGISFRSRIRISRAYFMPEEYEMLREFFNLVVKKQAEQIVFKKKK